MVIPLKIYSSKKRQYSDKSIEVDPDTYDDSNDSDDTVYQFETLDEFRRWLNADIHCIYKEGVI